jgi:predicted acetyltransferase
MSTEIRQATADEVEEFKRVAGNALVMNTDAFSDMRPEFTFSAFVDGKLATSHAAWPFQMRFNGAALPVAAVTAVGTLPVHRRQGNLRKIMNAFFAKLHEEGERPIAILLASLAAIYQRYGYAIVSTQLRYEVEPRYLRFSYDRPVPGRFRDATDDDFPVMVDLYRKFRAERMGYLHRGRPMWQAGVLAPAPKDGSLNRVIYEEDGEPLGHLVFTVEPGHGGYLPNAVLNIRDLVWLTPEAYRAAWNFLGNFDLVNKVIWGMAPSDDPLPHMLLEPRQLFATGKEGLLGRIIDVEKALPRRPYGKEGTLTFEVIDEICSWNRGVWKLDASAEGGSITKTTEEPQLVMPVGTLAMLVMGQITATEAARMQRLDVNRPEAPSLWDDVMRTKYRPAFADGF